MSTLQIRVTEGTHMDFIPTTATLVDTLRRKAKALKRASSTTLAAALDIVASEGGYLHWKHVTVCAEQTASRRQTNPPLEPQEVAQQEPVRTLASVPPGVPEELWLLMNDAEHRLYPIVSPETQSWMLHMARKSTPEGARRYQEVQSSVTSSWASAVPVHSGWPSVDAPAR